jgi:hypothetical protein
VPAHEFAFTLTLTGHAHNSEMVTGVVRSVLSHAGYTGDALERIVKQVSAACAEGGGALPCDVRFLAGDGALEIVVSQAGHDWRTTCPLLTRS